MDRRSFVRLIAVAPLAGAAMPAVAAALDLTGSNSERARVRPPRRPRNRQPTPAWRRLPTSICPS